MDQNNLNIAPESGTVISDEKQIEKADITLSNEFSSGSKKKYIRFTMTVLGSIPWIGSFISAAASLSAEKDQNKINELLKLWLMEHKDKIDKLNLTLTEIFTRLDNFGEEIQKRIESPEYLTLVRTTFKSWDNAETKDKRQMLKKLISNAGVTTLCPDDLVRLL